MEITEIHFESIDSTNAYAKREARSFAPDKITVVSTDSQTAGVGRYHRKWISPPHLNLALTFCFRLPKETPDIITLAIIGAHAIAKLLETKGLKPNVKWPNDVQINGKKCAGVLCEVEFMEDWIQVFLGMGVNVNMQQKDLDQIDQAATSMQMETGITWDLNVLKQELIAQVKQAILKFGNDA